MRIRRYGVVVSSPVYADGSLTYMTGRYGLDVRRFWTRKGAERWAESMRRLGFLTSMEELRRG